MSVRTDITDGTSVTQEETENLRMKIIDNQTKILNVISRNDEEGACGGDYDDDVELEMIDYMIEMCQQKIKNYTITKELNEDTAASLEEVAAGMEASDEELHAELTAVENRVREAKKTLDFVLQTYYAEYHEEMRSILMELEKASTAEDEEDRYVEFNDTSVESILILERALCIVQHPTKSSFFKLAPFD